jgi:probable phosphoglycerate mutase
MRVLAKRCRDAHNPSLVTYSWIPRDENSHADRLANKALDGGAANEPIEVRQENLLTDRLRSSEVPTTIYFVRHGETILTPTRKFSGTGALDPELTADGLAQAERVAAEVAKLEPDFLISSPLKRARQTADAIARTTGLTVIDDTDWYELSFGSWDGKSIEEVKAETPEDYQAWVNSSSHRPGGGESYDEAAVRIDAAMEKVLHLYPGKKVVVVTHNGVIKSAANLAIGGPNDGVFHMDATPCSISSVSLWPSDGLRALRSFNERGHHR